MDALSKQKDDSYVLENYFGLVRSFYNFQDEASARFTDCRAKVKAELSQYASMVLTLSEFAGTSLDLDSFADSLVNAEKQLSNNDGLVTVPSGAQYSYATSSPMFGHVYETALEMRFDSTSGNQFNGTFKISENNAELNYFNNGSLYSQEEMTHIFNRFQNLRYNAETDAKDFLSYCVKLNLLEEDILTSYASASGENKATAFPEDLPLLTSFTGLAEGESQVLRVYDSCDLSGSAFSNGKTFSYLGTDEKGNRTNPSNWHLTLVEGNLLSMNTLETINQDIDGIARYDESGPLLLVEEHHAFSMRSNGFLFVAFTKA